MKNIKNIKNWKRKKNNVFTFKVNENLSYEIQVNCYYKSKQNDIPTAKSTLYRILDTDDSFNRQLVDADLPAFELTEVANNDYHSIYCDCA